MKRIRDTGTLHLESFIPHWAKGPPNDSGCASLLSVHGEHGERVWKAE